MDITIRTSERTTFARCQYQWYLNYVEKLKPIREATPLWFGSAVHEALAAWYLEGAKRGPHPSETFNEILEGDRQVYTIPEDDMVEYEDARELGVAMLNNYVDYYDKDNDWDVIATEMTFQVKIKTTFGIITYVGTVDAVVRLRSTGEVWIIEHKTAAQVSTDHLPLDNQAGSYYAILSKVLVRKGVLKKGETIAGIMYNILKKSRKDDRPVNEEGLVCNNPQKKHYAAVFLDHFGSEVSGDGKTWDKYTIAELDSIRKESGLKVYGEPSKEQPAELLVREPVHRSAGERQTQIDRIKEEAVYMHGIRTGDPNYPIIKSVMQFGPTACPRCPFFQVCVLNEQGDSMEDDMKEVLYKKWEPYGEHEIKRKIA